MSDQEIHTGPRGGKYIISSTGRKRYIQEGKMSPRGNFGQTTGSPRSSWIKPGADITEQQGKYCRCEIEVAAKQSKECLKEVAEGKHTPIKGSGCYNVYSVCASRTGTSTGRKGCSQYYNWEQIPDEFLLSWLHLHKIPVNNNAPRYELLKKIQNKLAQKGETF